MTTEVTFYTDPYHTDKFEFIYNEESEVYVDHLFNSTYRVICNSTPSTLALISEIGYVYIFYTLDRNSENIDQFIQLLNEMIYNFFGIRITRMQIVMLESIVKLIPFFGDDRVYVPQELFIAFIDKYKHINENQFMLNDRYFDLYDYIESKLRLKGIEGRTQQIDKLLVCSDDQYILKVDSLNLMCKGMDYFSLNEYKFDPILELLLELIKLFDIKEIDRSNLVFKSDILNRNWLINSSFGLLFDIIPSFRIQTNTFMEAEIDDRMKAKMKLAAVLSYQKLDIPFDMDSILVHSDLSIQIPVYDVNMLNQFTQYLNDYLTYIDNWSIILCPSLGQGLSIKESINDTNLLSKESYIIEMNKNDYLIFLTTDFSRTIRPGDDIKSMLIKDALIDRGFKRIENESVKLDVKIADNKLVVEGRIVLVTDDKDELEQMRELYSRDIDNRWIVYHIIHNKKISNLITMVN